MNKETIEARIKLLEEEKAKAINAANLALIYEGALQDCRHWLTQLEEVKTDG